MTTKARVELDPRSFGLRVAILRDYGDSREMLRWEPATAVRVEANTPAETDCCLPLPEDVARAVYEALGDYFGHSTHDARALRRDYEAERKRVDLLIDRMVPRG